MEKKSEDHEKVQNELGLILTHVEGVSSWMLYTHTHTHTHQWEVSINSDHLLPDYFPLEIWDHSQSFLILTLVNPPWDKNLNCINQNMDLSMISLILVIISQFRVDCVSVLKSSQKKNS